MKPSIDLYTTYLYNIYYIYHMYMLYAVFEKYKTMIPYVFTKHSLRQCFFPSPSSFCIALPFSPIKSPSHFSHFSLHSTYVLPFLTPQLSISWYIFTYLASVVTPKISTTLLPKQCHYLGIKCSNTKTHRGHFTFN